MYPILFRIGSFPVNSWELFVLIGVWSAYFSLEYELRNRRIPYFQLISLIVIEMIACFIGAYWAQILTVGTPGYVIYGAIILGSLTGWSIWFIFNWKKRISFLEFCDVNSLPLAWAFGFVRLGCTLYGCCYGTPSHGWPGYILNEAAWDTDIRPFPTILRGTPLHPTPLYESIVFFLMVGFIYWARKKSVRLRFGIPSCLVWMFYAFIRFFLEWIRMDPRGGLFLELSPSQWVSLAFLLGGFGWIALFLRPKSLKSKPR